MKILDRLLKNKDISCADELNILDIEDNICYLADGYISVYIKIIPIAFDYLSLNEKQQIIDRFRNEFSGENEVIKIITMSLPLSTKEINEFLNYKRNKTNNAFKRSRLLSQIDEINKLGYRGEMIEKQVILQIYRKYESESEKELLKKANELVLKLKNAGLDSYILEKQDILQFFNSFLNMNFRIDNLNSMWSDDND